MKVPHIILSILILSFSWTDSLACTCECIGDCSFHTNINSGKLIALVKVVSYDSYLDGEIDGFGQNMPYSMTVEILKKYQGEESRKKIKIWGDNGILCRPYLSQFKIGDHYLISPQLLGENRVDEEAESDYEFFVCNTEYLRVDLDSNLAYGEYSKRRKKISLDQFEAELKQ